MTGNFIFFLNDWNQDISWGTYLILRMNSPITEIRVAQPQQLAFWTRSFFTVGAVLRLVGCSAESLPSTHWTPAAIPTHLVRPTIARARNVSCRAKSAQLKTAEVNMSLKRPNRAVYDIYKIIQQRSGKQGWPSFDRNRICPKNSLLSQVAAHPLILQSP